MPIVHETPKRLTGPLLVAETVAGLRLIKGVDRGVCLLLGGAAAFDGDGGLFAYDAADDTSDDGAATIKPTAVSGDGRWRKVVSETGGE